MTKAEELLQEVVRLKNKGNLTRCKIYHLVSIKSDSKGKRFTNVDTKFMTIVALIRCCLLRSVTSGCIIYYVSFQTNHKPRQWLG